MGNGQPMGLGGCGWAALGRPRFAAYPRLDCFDVHALSKSVAWNNLETVGCMTDCLLIFRVFGMAICASSLMNLFIPAAAKMHFGVVMILKILQGLVEVMSFEVGETRSVCIIIS